MRAETDMAEGTCTIDGCGAFGRIRRGRCNRHYGQWQRHGDPTGNEPRPECSVNDCSTPTAARGLCAMHYRRMKETGTTDPRPPRTKQSREERARKRREYYLKVERPRSEARHCRIDGCPNSANRTADLCVSHYYKIRKYGDPHGSAPEFRTQAMRDFVATFKPADKVECSVEGCSDEVSQKAFCAEHYRVYRKWGHPLGEQVPRKAPRRVAKNASPEERFWAKVDTDGPVPTSRPELGPCWVWLAATDANGYGTFAGRRGFSKLAHRFSWDLAGREFVEGRVLDHICKVHWCVRPDHLRQIGLVANVMIGDTPTVVNRKKTHCKRGHPFDEQNTLYYKGRPDRRTCRICHNANVRNRARIRRAIAKGAIAA